MKPRALTDEEIATAPLVQVLQELAEFLQWPRCFDSADGEKYAELVRARLLKELAF